MAKLSGLLATSEPDLGALRRRRPRPARRRRAGAGASRAPRRCARSWPPAARRQGRAPSSPSPPPTGRPRTSAPPRRTCSAATPSPCCPAGRRCRTSGSRRARTPSGAGCRSSARLADPATAPRLVVAAARSLIQPIAPGLGRLDPVTLRVGDEHDFDDLLVRLVELAYTRVEMVTARGEFAVRGGIVDVFPPTAEHPVRVEFWGDEVSELRSFAVADQRSVAPVDELHAPGCRELLLTAEVRDRAAALARAHENNPAAARAAGAPGRGHPGRGHGVADPGAGRRAELELLTDLLPGRRAGAARRPGADPHPRRRPRPHRPGVPRGELVRRRDRRRRPDRRRRQSPTAASTTCSSTPRRPATRSSRSAR